MPTIRTKDGTGIYYKDWGAGQPVVLRHGWPLSGDAFEYQMFLHEERNFVEVVDGTFGIPVAPGSSDADAD